MRVRVLAVGTRMPEWVVTAYEEYTRRLRTSMRIDLEELPVGKSRAEEQQRFLERAGSDYLVALDERGKSLTTLQLARWLGERQQDEHFYTVCRYVERNAQRAKLVRRAEDWRWGSLRRWASGTAKEKSLLAAWPLSRRPGWLEHVNRPQTEAELAALRQCAWRGCPYGDGKWSERMIKRLGLESTVRRQGRPRKKNGS
jgi:hypothetical protein